MEKSKIIYVYDALCGWCYGFSPVIRRLYDKYYPKIDFEVLSGGMVTGENAGPIGEVAGYIKTAYKRVEATCGVEFGQAFLDDVLAEGSTNFNSLPPAIAMAVFRKYEARKQVLFAGALQRAIYYDGIDPEDFEAYSPYAKAFGIAGGFFVRQMEEEKFLRTALAEFDLVKEAGVTAFPTVFMHHQGKLYLLARGYRPYHEMDALIDQLQTGGQRQYQV